MICLVMQVFFWNFAISFICGNATIWKPSPTTPCVRFLLVVYPLAVRRSLY